MFLESFTYVLLDALDIPGCFIECGEAVVSVETDVRPVGGVELREEK